MLHDLFLDVMALLKNRELEIACHNTLAAIPDGLQRQMESGALHSQT